MFHTYINSIILILLTLIINTIFSIRIGSISNTAFLATINGQTYSNVNCRQCTCIALISSAVGWNCIMTNNTCNLIKNYSLNDIGLIVTFNTTFFFQIIPPERLLTTNKITTISTTTSTTTITPACTPLGSSTFLSKDNPTVWTQFNATYTASSTSFTLQFAFKTDASRYYYLDNISVIKLTSPSIELLENSDFENLTTVLNGWLLWCSHTCDDNSTQIISGTNCLMSIGNCFQIHCHSGQAVIFLSQSFATERNQTYRISFWIRQAGTGGKAQTKFDFTVV